MRVELYLVKNIQQVRNRREREESMWVGRWDKGFEVFIAALLKADRFEALILFCFVLFI